ncbi:MAG: MATE family efflux transporter [Phascolarctobacterium sp.]|nr:MATE family efflux transporter [Phascolarctobacterium sp.]
MLALFDKNNRDKLNNLIVLMLPILGTQLANMGMGFFDASMSGQAGNVDLAGAAIGSNTWAPLHTGFGGVLLATMPLVANALGEGNNKRIGSVITQGMLLAMLFGLLVIASGIVGLPILLNRMGLEQEVYHIALWYCAGVGLGVIPFFLTVPLRCLVDTLGHTDLSMKLYVLGLPINAFLNYLLIFGKCGLPRLGGIGAGLATGLTYWVLFIFFSYTVLRVKEFRKYISFEVPKQLWQQLHNYLRIGIPMGFSIFLEVAIFCVVAFFEAKFGTDVIAAHQAAMNMSCIIYMIPLSFSMALTIVVGVEYGAKRFVDSKIYTRIGIQLSIAVAFIYLTCEFLGREILAYIYSTDANVRELFCTFMAYAVVWQCGDMIAAPIQGILRGYKDVDSGFWSNVLAYWIICLPLGLLLDYYCGLGPFAYWISLVLGVLCSAAFMVYRLRWFEERHLKHEN